MANGERTENHPNRQVGRLRGSSMNQTPQQPASRLRGKGLVSEEKSEPKTEKPTSEYQTYESGGTVESRAKANKELRYRNGNAPTYPGTRFRGSGFVNED
jgi:hypothetical protein